MPEFNPMRVLRNRVVDEWNDRVDEIPVERPLIGHVDLGGALDSIRRAGQRPEGRILGGQGMDLRRFSNFVPIASTTGDLEEMPLLAGQGVGLVHSVPGAGEVVAAMVAEAEQALGSVRRS